MEKVEKQTLIELIRNYVEQGDFTHELYKRIANIVKNCQYVRRLDVIEYDVEDANYDIVQEFIIYLMEKSRFQYVLNAFSSGGEPESYIGRCLLQFLYDKSYAKTEKARIEKRIKNILKNPPFQRISSHQSKRNSDVVYGLLTWEKNKKRKSSYDIIESCWSIPHQERKVYRKNSSKAAPLISKSDLTRLLKEIFTKSDSPIRFCDIKKIIEDKITLDDQNERLVEKIEEFEDSDQPLQNTASLVTREVKQEREQLVRRFIRSLKEKEYNFFKLYLEWFEKGEGPQNISEIAKQINVPVSSAHSLYRRVFKSLQKFIRQHCLDEDQANDMMKIFREIILGNSGQRTV